MAEDDLRAQGLTTKQIYNRAYYARNKEQMLAASKARRRADPDAIKAEDARQYQRHRDAKRAAAKLYKEANPEKARQWHRDWEKANPERKAAYGRARRAKQPEVEVARVRDWRRRNRELVNAKKRAEFAADPEKFRAYTRKWRSNNRERANALARQWYRDNTGKRKELDHGRRLANGSGIQFTSDDLVSIFEDQQGACLYCQAELASGYEVDHFIPIARGGGHEPHNIVLACMPCNRSKGAKLPWHWKPDMFPERK